MLKFQPENAPKAFGGRAPPGPTGEAYSAPPDLLARFKSGDRDRRRRKGKTHEGGQLRKENRESEEGAGEGEEGRKRWGEKGKRNLAPRLFLKVGAYLGWTTILAALFCTRCSFWVVPDRARWST